MPIRAAKVDVLALVKTQLLAEAEAAAGSNHLLSKAEQDSMPEGLLKTAADWVRLDGGAGTRVDVDTLVSKAARRTATLLGRVNQTSGAGAAVVSRDEIRALHGLNKDVGLRVARAYELITGKQVELPAPVAALPASSAILSTLGPSLRAADGSRGEIEVFNESGDNGVNTFADALPGATDLNDAIANAKQAWSSWGFNAWEMDAQDTTSAEAIEGFLTAARGLYQEEDLDPAQVDGIIQAFADRVKQAFGSLEEVRLATGPTVDFERGGTYLFGKTSDGWVALAVRQYRDG